MQLVRSFSPVEQELIWVSEYSDGTFLFEFDFLTKEQNEFNTIERNKLIRFGLIGLGHKFYYELFGGIFKIDGHMFEFVYEDENGKEYLLSGQNKFYRDIIQYKDAETMFNPLGTSLQSFDRINQFNFGYKEIIDIDDVYFNFKSIFSAPLYNGTPYFSIRIVSNKDFNGKLKIRRDSILVDEFSAPLKANESGEINWVVK